MPDIDSVMIPPVVISYHLIIVCLCFLLVTMSILTILIAFLFSPLIKILKTKSLFSFEQGIIKVSSIYFITGHFTASHQELRKDSMSNQISGIPLIAILEILFHYLSSTNIPPT